MHLIMNKQESYTENRYVVIYGYSEADLKGLLRHFESQLPPYITLKVENKALITKITLSGTEAKSELLKFQIGRLQQTLQNLFEEEFVTNDERNLSAVLGDLLLENELTVSCAESCTGGNIAHSIVQTPGSSSYFMGSVVSYSNDVKADVLGVSRSNISRFGAVSKEVVEEMAMGASKLMRTDCAIATSGIAGPEGGSKFKPVGTVWFAVKYHDMVVTECVKFNGNRMDVMQKASNHAMMMLTRILRNKYSIQEDINDD